MEAASELGIAEGDEVEVFPYIEPLASIGVVLRFASSTQTKLVDLLEPPKTYTKSKVVLCPWKDKGRVMGSSSAERSRKTLCTWTVSRNTLPLAGL